MWNPLARVNTLKDAQRKLLCIISGDGLSVEDLKEYMLDENSLKLKR